MLGALTVGILAAGCSSLSNPGVSFKDGKAFAQGQIQQGTPLVADAKTACAVLAAQGSVPNLDDQGQWEAGCEAGLANATFMAPGS
jgi:hypothetical protein